jgi:hypothetical protein
MVENAMIKGHSLALIKEDMVKVLINKVMANKDSDNRDLDKV